ncbi:MAG: sporulation protein YqfD [Oscillospiraceae bacterium]|nr:sporulation protein YqfD [Oscillospiraceae bacterium]
MRNQFGSGWEFVIQDTSPAGLLNELSEKEIRFSAVHPLDEVTVYLRASYGEVRRVRAVAERRGSDLRMCRPYGLRPKLRQIGKRYVLLTALTVCAACLALSNLFVWRIEVIGNEQVAAGEVVRAVTQAGGGIGSFWPGFDSEQMRTQLLLQLEKVQWVGINYRSGAIEVVVREREPIPEIIDNDEPVHIVAEKAGVLTGITAKQGQTRAAAGDTVEKGQVLISGAAVSSIGTTRPVHALGEVEARTWYAISARQPAFELGKAYSGRKTVKISLILGSKRVNFYSDSSIFEDSCDTIIMDYHLCMKDVFTLPVRIMVQQRVYWSAQERETDIQVREEAARAALMEVLKYEIGEDGSVITADFATLSKNDGMTVTMMAECLEKIGEEVPISEEELRQIQLPLRDEATTND